ncbi:hypothetical protein G6F57_022210 [Rhizopus arrhizus]|nr:hypothetical protein G6F57_022210 [Rhizopus arrhizus]
MPRVGHERGDGRARARHGAEQRADRRAPHHRPERGLQFLLGGTHVADAQLGAAADDGHAVDAHQEVGHAEQAHRDRHQLQAVGQVKQAEREADGARVHIGAHHAAHQAEQPRPAA